MRQQSFAKKASHYLHALLFEDAGYGPLTVLLCMGEFVLTAFIIRSIKCR